MERTVTPRLALTLFVALLLSLTATLPVAFAQGPVPMSRSLRAALASATPTTALEVIVTFKGEGPLSTQQLDALRSIGVRGASFRALPIAGVLATPAQVSALANRADVRSLWLNEQLTYDNHDATALTGVDRLRTDSRLRTAAGLPFSGKGVGVVINDSGVDGTHADIQYGDHLVQNVLGQTNLHAVDTMLPITYAEGVSNTDHGGGHGTHVAGIIGATGARSGGYHEGVAPGASLIGYGSGAGLFILDTIGGFDYALVNQIRYNIRVISNSFGNTGDVNTDFDPNDPTNVATKALADRGVVVVFSAGNSGSGEGSVTGNFKKAPWVVMVAAGDREGNLAAFSSRGRKNVGGTVEVDGESYTWVDRPTVTAPGVNVVSARASTGSTNGADDDAVLPPAYIPFYTILSGTSMACPHVSGIVALMLEANPQLNVYDVKQILEATSTNMAGREDYEVGAGYANAYNAVVAALGRRTDFGGTRLLGRSFNSSIALNDLSQNYSLTFDPSGVTTKKGTFTVAAGTSQLAGRVSVAGLARESGNTLGLRFTAPNGTRYTSGVTALFAISYIRSVVVDNPMPGTWTVDLYGVNGAGVPETATATVVQRQSGTASGLADAVGHAAEGAIFAAVSDRLVDGLSNGTFSPDAVLTRGQLAQYLAFGAGVRQNLRLSGGFSFGDVTGPLAPFAEAATTRGGALKDRFQTAAAVMRTTGGLFRPDDAVTKLDLAYSLVQSLGLESIAKRFTGTPEAEYNGQKYPLADAGAIPADLKGYVQLAISLGILNARFSLEQGPYDLAPTLKARFDGGSTMTRAAYAVAATRFFPRYNQVDLAASLSTTESTGPAPALSQSSATAGIGAATLAFEPVSPNPARGTATVRFRLPEAQRVKLAVYDAVGREVAVLADGDLSAGAHTAQFSGDALAAGVYVMRLTSGAGVLTRTVTLLK